MNKTVIVSASPQRAEVIEQTVRGLGFGTTTISGGSELRRMLRDGNIPELIIIAAPLSDELGSDLAEEAVGYPAGVIFICGSDLAAEFHNYLGELGAAVLTAPVSREELTEAVRRVTGDEDMHESSDLMSRIDDIRLINKAKSVLMKYLKFTEPQAHRYIEKQAMNSRCTRREAAEKIINTYK